MQKKVTIKETDILFAGIDGGGTNCRARIETADGTLVGTGLGGTANPSHGLPTVTDSIMAALEMALKQAGLPVELVANLIVGAGLAGLHLAKYRDLMASWQHPFKALYLTDDLHVATRGAHNGGDGAVVIVGTGFSALSLVKGHETAIGGHGFLQADYCSGGWIGYQAVQAVLLADDNLAESTQLSDLLYQKYNATGLELADRLVGATAREYGELAPLVFTAAEQGDAVAGKIITESGQFLERVISQLLKTNPPRLSLVGSIAERLIPRLNSELVDKISAPIKTPEVGAVNYARQQYKGMNAESIA